MIKSHQEFSEIIHRNQYQKNDCLSIYFRPTKYRFNHYGIAITKKIGNAVTRNKNKRRMRVIMDKYKNLLRTNFDYIIIMKENCNKYSFQELEKKYLNLIERIKYEK